MGMVMRRIASVVTALVMVVAVASAGLVVEPAGAQETVGGCPIVSDQAIVVSLLTGSVPPSEEQIYGNRGEAGATGSLRPATIPAGTYDIVLASFDDHVINGAVKPTQEREQFVVQGFDGSSVVFTSNPISDLPDTENLRVETVGVGVEVPSLTAVRAFHAAYPDPSSANSITPLCVAFVPVQAPPGRIETVKELSGTLPDGTPVPSFTFEASYQPDGFSLGLGDRHTSGDLAPGTYSVAEVPDSYEVDGGRWDLVVVSCSDGSDPSSIDLAPGELVTCTFFNAFTPEPSPETGNIVVEKRYTTNGQGADPLPAGVVSPGFGFQASWTDGFTLEIGQTHESGPLAPGSYSVDETGVVSGDPDRWSPVSAECSDGSDPGDISLEAGETVRCVFLNTRSVVEEIQVTTTTTVDSTTTTTGGTTTSSVSASTLPFTGSESGTPVLVAIAAIGAGLGLLLVARRPARRH